MGASSGASRLLRQAELRHAAAVDRPDLSCNERGFVRGEPCDQGSHLLGRARTADRMDTPDVTSEAHRIRHALDKIDVEIRIDPSRSDCIAANAFNSMIHSDGARQAV